MESEDVKAKVDWEERRVAAAFGVARWERDYTPWRTGLAPTGQVVQVEFCMESPTIRRLMIGIYTQESGDLGDTCSVWIERKDPAQRTYPSREINVCYNEIMARGLYRLGIEDEEWIAPLNHPLTAHEKLELRKTMPREFWPQKWLDEE